MLNFLLMPKFNKAESESSGGGSGYVAPKESVPESKKESPAPQPSANSAPSEASGEEFDDLGYAIPKKPEGDKKPSGDAKPKDEKPPAEDKKEVDKPASGYSGKSPEPIEEKKTETPVADIDLGFELKVDSIIPKDEAQKIKEFAKTHKMNKEATQAYLDLRKGQLEAEAKALADAKAEGEKQIKAQRHQWYNELKNDPTFGGEKFERSVAQAEKVLQEFMPNTKKVLTERGSMLPPYVMRDLMKLSEHLFATDKIVQGEPPVPKEQTQQVPEELAFYQ